MAPGAALLGRYGGPNPAEGTGTVSTQNKGLQHVPASLGRGDNQQSSSF